MPTKATKKPLIPEKSVEAAIKALEEIASDVHKYEPKTRIEAARELLRYASGTEGTSK